MTIDGFNPLRVDNLNLILESKWRFFFFMDI